MTDEEIRAELREDEQNLLVCTASTIFARRLAEARREFKNEREEVKRLQRCNETQMLTVRVAEAKRTQTEAQLAAETKRADRLQVQLASESRRAEDSAHAYVRVRKQLNDVERVSAHGPFYMDLLTNARELREQLFWKAKQHRFGCLCKACRVLARTAYLAESATPPPQGIPRIPREEGTRTNATPSADLGAAQTTVGAHMRTTMERDALRGALIIQARGFRRKGYDLCFCAPEYDVDKYGHSIACGSANDVLSKLT